MKYIFSILLIICCLSTTKLRAQTYELEKRYLEKEIKDNYNSKYNAERKLATIRELLNNSDYPKAPYDTVAQNFDFRFSIPVPDSLQEEVFDKLVEWSVAGFIQPGFGIKMQDSARHKLVVYGYSELIYAQPMWFGKYAELKKKCHYSLIMKILDGKIEGRFLNVEYVTETVKSSDAYYHTTTDLYKIGALFPITKSTISEMELNVSLIISTNLELKRIEQEIANFIKNP